jgi:glutaredoxin
MRLKTILYLAMFLVVGVGSGLLAGRYVVPLFRPGPPPIVSEGDFAAEFIEPAGTPVVMFSLSTCPHCADARKYFAAHGIAYSEYAIDQSDDAKRRFEAMDEPAVPVILTAHHKIRAFDPVLIARVFAEDGIVPAPPAAASR